MLSLTIANLKMMARNRQATFWALFFPLLLVVVFGLLEINGFGGAKLAVIDQAGTDASRQLRAGLADIEFLEIEFRETESSVQGVAYLRQRVLDGDLSYLVVIPEGFGQAPDSSKADSSIADSSKSVAGSQGRAQVALLYSSSDQRLNQLVDGVIRNLVVGVQSRGDSENPTSLVRSEVLQVLEVSYFDGVLMGLIALGIMTNSIISIAVRISTYRNQAILKRLLVTPLPIWKYFAGEIAAHLVLALFQAAIILAVGVFVFGARVHGNPAWIFVIVPLGSIVFLNIGFILSAWAKTPAAASGMGNAIALPMMFFAGTFFSTATLPWVLPYLAQALPLTPMLVALRQVSVESAPLWDTWPSLATLAAWAVGTGLVATRVFKFS